MRKLEKYRVALADDHAILRKGLVHIINSFEQYEVTIEAADGQELIDKIQAATEKPHFCIMDIQMHGMDGYDATKIIKKKWPAIHVLALSMHQNEFTILRMMRNGARGFLPKEAGPKDLRDAMDAMREGYVYYSNLIDEKVIARAEDATETRMLDLTSSEISFLKYCCSDYVYKDIARELNLSQRTIDWYRDKMYEKLGVSTRAGLVIFAIQFGIEPMDVKSS
ncbi:hypothetical protein CAP35_12665 [Chitinophagaceae bacterium IBVUCB1]|nr:hypothetical protein CAP35_12665 [Chitinophagaceae bacterium IBVUCB1]